MATAVPGPCPRADRGRRARDPTAPGPGAPGRAPAPEVHRGDCWARGTALRPVSAEEARAALAEGVQPCEVCRPDRVLTP
ncbi:DUF6233 domain-containing protein [Streptomyces californicus]|uniref:DUF6233 domain-containing protein n=1 Tax=Streptomyces californicus TaxID=67351 RepID=UPI0037FC9EFB